ncbi:pyridoxal phosphate-dependent aminotransferase [Clostridium sp. SHJSY1]|uniref:pyridoxal phosphate-dependent aminotransferase n=1 Tax=Clostridium sp. SHJSY1 TaxID=2942483 RepID=UPI002876AD0B|nr:pyridoxal phosphate-dependent aminotransferase [Clostridium sp. SHJSY1]MDS0524140.1 pyridoxal phosphate-dependent aminotransferase [Clostridium sp. SHJSY1]
MGCSKKAENITPSITLAITTKAKELSDAGVDVVSFGVGEPDFNTPKHIIEAAIKAMEEGKTKYTATPGILELRKAICNKFKKDNGLDYTPDQIVVSTGAKQCLANAFMSILNPEDEVLVSSPYWVSYPELIRLADGVPVIVETNKESNYKFNLELLNKYTTNKTKALVINSPNNPTGTIYSKEEFNVIADFAKEKDLIIIADEIYEKLIYDGEKHVSIASISEDSYKRTIVINGLSKAYAMTGWRIGYSAASKEISKLMSSIQSHMSSNTNSITQYAAVAALNGPEDEQKVMVQEFEKRRNYMLDRISKIKNISCIEPSGAFYVMINIEKFFGKTINDKRINNSVGFSSMLLEEENVAVVPGAGFGVDNYVRVSYATSMETIKKGLDRIENFIKKIK